MNAAVSPKDIVDRISEAQREVRMGSCDTCGARAFYFAVVNDVDLAYCGHHATKYEERLLAVASKTVDLRHMI